MSRIQQLAKERQAFVEKAGAIHKKAQAAGRSMSAEELQEFNGYHDEADKLQEQITNEEKAQARQQRAEEFSNSSGGRRPGLKRSDGGGTAVADRVIRLHYATDRRTGKKLRTRIMPGTAAHRRCSGDYGKRWMQMFLGEATASALQLDKGTKGGYLASERFVAQMIKEADNLCFIRDLARKIPLGAGETSLGAPGRAQRLSSARWGAELSDSNDDTSLKINKRRMELNYLSGSIPVSREFLNIPTIDGEAFVMEEILRDKNELEEDAYINGDGDEKPLGVFFPCVEGINTDRDFVGDNTATELKFKTILQAPYQLKLPYRRSKACAWLMSRNTIRYATSLCDSTGRPLWEKAEQSHEPATFNGYAVYESEYAPGIFTANAYVAILGDWYQYWIADGLEFSVQRLIETKARQNQDEFIYRHRTDGAPVLGEAFVRIQLAA